VLRYNGIKKTRKGLKKLNGRRLIRSEREILDYRKKIYAKAPLGCRW
jgi:hypothetical protein